MSEYTKGVSRHTVESEINIGSMVGIDVESKDVNHIYGEITIEISGAESDRPDTYRLQEQIQKAVHDTVRNFEVQK